MFFILEYGIFRNFGIWNIGIYFGIRVKLILGYGIFWTVYFGIWDTAYPPNQASKMVIFFRYQAHTDLETSSTRMVFPCFDEPAFKAVFDFTIARKAGKRTLSNAELNKTFTGCVNI